MNLELISQVRQLGYEQGFAEGYKKGYSDGLQTDRNSEINEDDVAIMAASARGMYNGGIDEAKRQRDKYKAERDSYIELIDHFFSGIIEQHASGHDRWGEDAALLRDTLEQYGQPATGQILASISDDHVQAAHKLISAILDKVEGENVSPAQKLSLAQQADHAVVSASFGRAALRYALIFYEHPPAICDQIMQGLRDTGKADEKWLGKLTSWLAAQSEAPKKIQVVKEYLELYADFLRSNQKQFQYAMNHHTEERTLQRAGKLYELIDTQSRLLPEQFASHSNKIAGSE